MPREAADQRDLLGLDGTDEVLRVVPELEHVVGDAAAPDGVDPLAVRAAQRLAVEVELAHVAHAARHAAAREQLGEDAELVNHAVLEVVADGEAGPLDLVRVGAVDRQELVHPRLEQVASDDAVAFAEGRERLRARDGVGDLAVLVHAGRPVAVELAELHVEGVLVYEGVDAGERQQRVVAPRQQDEPAQPLVEVEQAAVVLVVEVALHHLAQDAVRRLGGRLHRVVGALAEEPRNERAGDHLVVHDGGGALHVVEGAPPVVDGAVQLVDDVEVLGCVVGVGSHGGPFVRPGGSR